MRTRHAPRRESPRHRRRLELQQRINPSHGSHEHCSAIRATASYRLAALVRASAAIRKARHLIPRIPYRSDSYGERVNCDDLRHPGERQIHSFERLASSKLSLQ